MTEDKLHLTKGRFRRLASTVPRTRTIVWQRKPKQKAFMKSRAARAGRSLNLRPTEYRLLEFLLEHPGRVFTREQLLDGVWGRDVYIDERTVDVHVGRLRKAVNNGRMPDVIRTIRGSGYAISEE